MECSNNSYQKETPGMQDVHRVIWAWHHAEPPKVSFKTIDAYFAPFSFPRKGAFPGRALYKHFMTIVKCLSFSWNRWRSFQPIAPFLRVLQSSQKDGGNTWKDTQSVSFHPFKVAVSFAGLRQLLVVPSTKLSCLLSTIKSVSKWWCWNFDLWNDSCVGATLDRRWYRCENELYVHELDQDDLEKGVRFSLCTFSWNLF